MNAFLSGTGHLLLLAWPWLGAFLLALVLTLLAVPPVKALNRALGMVDKPSARRINTTPVPRGGGIAVFAVFALVCLAFPGIFGRPLMSVHAQPAWKLLLPAALLTALGYGDDKFSLPPAVKLLGQIAVALLAVLCARLGFANVWPGLPPALDTVLTVFWIVGAINAFNLIDGLDGLASGLALIAVAGMAGTLFCLGRGEQTYVHFIAMGCLLGFLRYNFNPASVFLGDSGSMFLGFLVATLPLAAHASNSFLVGVGIPVLAMGVPIFDTTLAIVRRTLRAILRRLSPAEETGNGAVMTADTDHLHHRILRRFASQRRAAFILYGFALLLVSIGVGGMLLKGRAAVLFILGFMTVSYIIFRDMRRIELWDMGRLLNAAAHETSAPAFRRRVQLIVPLLIAGDFAVMAASWFIAAAILALPRSESFVIRGLVLRLIPTFFALVFFRAYTTVWGRALLSNYVRLLFAVILGAAATAVLVVAAGLPHTHLFAFTVMFTSFAFTGFVLLRFVRQAVRDFFYTLDAGELIETAKAKRIVVYGAGLRYRAFRRELVRSAAKADRVIVGLLDDDVFIRGQYIGGIKVYGPLEEAPQILKRLNADGVVVAAKLTPERRARAREIFAASGVEASQFAFTEGAL